MTAKKCIKVLMGCGLSKKEAARMVSFLRARKIPRSGIVFTVINPAGSYGKECNDRVVWINGTSADADAIVRAAIPEKTEV